jgi:hypothetical protein
MSSTAARPYKIERPASVFQAVMSWVSIPMALLLPLWVVAGRALFGAGGWMVVILGLTLGPVLVLLLLWSAILITVNAGRYRPYGAPLKTSFLLLGVYAAGFLFGFTVPDFGDAPDSGGSAMSRLLGEETSGISAALSNPFGIALLGLSILLLVTAIKDSRRARRERMGG